MSDRLAYSGWSWPEPSGRSQDALRWAGRSVTTGTTSPRSQGHARARRRAGARRRRSADAVRRRRAPSTRPCDGQRLGDRERARSSAAVDRTVVCCVRRRVAGAEPVAAVLPDADQHERRAPAAPMNFSQNCSACANVIERMPPDHDRGQRRPRTTTSPPSPARRAGLGAQRQGRALQLRHEVEPADQHDQHAGHPADRGRAQPDLGEVGQRVRAAAPQRGGHQREQDQVAGGVADRVPEHVEAEGEDEPGDAEEGRGGQVLAADRRRVPARRDRARGDVEVAGGAGPAQPEASRPSSVATTHRATTAIERREPGCAHRLPDQFGERPLVALGVPHGVPAERDQHRVHEHAEHQPGQRNAEHADGARSAARTAPSSAVPASSTVDRRAHDRRPGGAGCGSARSCTPRRARSARRSRAAAAGAGRGAPRRCAGA